MSAISDIGRDCGFAPADNHVYSTRWTAAYLTALAVFAVTAFSPGVLNDSDTYWHISAGQWMLQHHAILKADPFSFTASGAPWQAQEWLSEILMALAYNAGGFGLVMILAATAAAAAACVVGLYLSRRLSSTPLLLVLVLSLSCMAPSLLARPHLLALPMLALWTAGLVRARSENRTPPFLLVPVMAVWANLHGSFVLGLGLCALLALEAVIESKTNRTEQFRKWCVFGLAATAAAVLTPNGLEGLVFPFRLMAMHGLSYIGEWQPTSFATLQPLELMILCALFIFATRGVKLPALRLAIALLFLHMALQHSRHQIVFAVVVPLLLADSLGEAFRNVGTIGLRAHFSKQAVGIATGAAMLAMIGLRMAWPTVISDNPNAPVTALAHVPPNVTGRPVLNDYAFGGYLIFNGIKPFIDSRADLYGDTFLNNYAAIIAPDRTALTSALKKYGIRWTIFSAKSPTNAMLDLLPGWHRVYSDHTAVVHVAY